MKLTTLLLAPLVTCVLGHYKWPALIENDEVTPDYLYVRVNTNNINPIMNLTSLDMRCNEGGLDSGPQTSTATVQAGATVGFTLSNAIGHIGPVVVYMAKSPTDPSQWDGSGDVFFKINEWGPEFPNGQITWPQLGKSYSSRMWLCRNSQANLLDCFNLAGLTSYNFTIPPATPDGYYFIRIEHIAVHNAANYGGCQFFIACAQVQVTGGGSGSPGPLVAFPGAYSPNDPGILFNNYYPPPTSYQIPGPAVWAG